jgi:hypothetical protein
MNDAELQSILERCERATAGEWCIQWQFNIMGHDRLVANTGGSTSSVAQLEFHNQNIANADFIAHARTDLPAVVKELLEARGLLRGWLDNVEREAHPFRGIHVDTRVFLGGGETT